MKTLPPESKIYAELNPDAPVPHGSRTHGSNRALFLMIREQEALRAEMGEEAYLKKEAEYQLALKNRFI